MNQLTEKLDSTAVAYGMVISAEKRKLMVTSKTVLNIQQNITIGDKTLEQVDKYLGSTVTNDVNCKSEVKTRIAVGTSALTKLNPILKNSTTLKTKIHLLRLVVWATTLYACESWALHSITKK